MTYVTNQVVHDADSHYMETPDWLIPHADVGLRERISQLNLLDLLGGSPIEPRYFEKLRARKNDPELRAKDESDVMLRKMWEGLGAFVPEDRTRALNLLGFSSQLVFSSFSAPLVYEAEIVGDDVDYTYRIAETVNRAMLDFCSVDQRLLSTANLPLQDFGRAKKATEEAIKQGFNALLVSAACPQHHSPSHIELYPVWAQIQEAGIPVLIHVGSGGQFTSPSYLKTGVSGVELLHGEGALEQYNAKTIMSVAQPAMQFLSALIFDGVLERFPNLKFGVIELGATWLPGWIKLLDTIGETFKKFEPQLADLSLRPSEYVSRQIRVTPYITDDVGWITEQTNDAICMFSSDYPHPEGGRNPIARFNRSLEHLSPNVSNKFFRENFVDLMGTGLSKELNIGQNSDVMSNPS